MRGGIDDGAVYVGTTKLCKNIVGDLAIRGLTIFGRSVITVQRVSVVAAFGRKHDRRDVERLVIVEDGCFNFTGLVEATIRDVLLK